VCIPKTRGPSTPANYRPITLLNTNYKIFARIMAYRLRPLSPELLHPSQYCGVAGSTMFDEKVTVRDAIAHAEVTQDPLCILSLDFK